MSDMLYDLPYGAREMIAVIWLLDDDLATLAASKCKLVTKATSEDERRPQFLKLRCLRAGDRGGGQRPMAGRCPPDPPKVPKLAGIMDDAETEAYIIFPRERRVQLHSTNPIERLNRENKRRSQGVCIFPNDDAIIRLVGAILLEQNEE